jgi:hypothetical protein
MIKSRFATSAACVLLVCTGAAAVPFTSQSLVDNQLDFKWEVVWDRSQTLGSLNTNSIPRVPAGATKYWQGLIFSQAPSGSTTANKLIFQLTHFDDGPEEVELIPHNDSDQYTFEISPTDAAFGLGGSQNLPGSARTVAHPTTAASVADHRDFIRVEHKQLDGFPTTSLLTFIGVHQPQPKVVAEPGTLGLLAAGLAALGGIIRKRRR